MHYRRSARTVLATFGALAFGSIAAVGIAAAVPEEPTRAPIAVSTARSGDTRSGSGIGANDAAAGLAFEELRAGY